MNLKAQVFRAECYQSGGAFRARPGFGALGRRAIATPRLPIRSTRHRTVVPQFGQTPDIVSSFYLAIHEDMKRTPRV